MTTGAVLKFPLAAQTPPAAVRPAGMRVRPLIEDDLELLADLFLQRFRKSRRSPQARAEIAKCMKSLYLDHPTRQGEADALVAVDSVGDIAAFCGGVRTPFRLDGQPVTACVTGTLMASTAPGHALAAVQILRESRKLDYDLIVTDSANRASLAMCQAVGYQVVSPDSLEWAYVFDPASLALHKMRQRFGVSALGVLAPLAHGADFVASAALRAAAGKPKRSDWRDEEADAETFAKTAARFSEPFRLRPDYAPEHWSWLTGLAKRRRSAGPLHLRVLYDGAGSPSGAYAAFGGKGDVARIFHAVAAPHAWGRLFDRMRESARERGCIAAHGPLKKPMMAHAYATRGVFFYYAGGTLLYSNRPDVRRAAESGEALFGGFAGDRWTQLASDAFA